MIPDSIPAARPGDGPYPVKFVKFGTDGAAGGGQYPVKFVKFGTEPDSSSA